MELIFDPKTFDFEGCSKLSLRQFELLNSIFGWNLGDILKMSRKEISEACYSAINGHFEDEITEKQFKFLSKLSIELFEMGKIEKMDDDAELEKLTKTEASIKIGEYLKMKEGN